MKGSALQPIENAKPNPIKLLIASGANWGLQETASKAVALLEVFTQNASLVMKK